MVVSLSANVRNRRRGRGNQPSSTNAHSHPEQGFRSCVGILRLVKRYGAERVDAACARALVLGTRSYTSVAAILKNRRERAPSGATELPLLIHENIRGPDYYH